MVLILDVNSVIGAHVRREIGYLICLRYLFGARAVADWNFSQKRPVFLYKCATWFDIQSNVSSMFQS